MERDYKEIGERIQILRKKSGYTQKSLSEALQVTQSHISQVERGAAISDALVELLAEKFDVSPSYILTGEDDESWYSEMRDEDYSDIDKFLSMRNGFDEESKRQQEEWSESLRQVQSSEAAKEIAELLSDNILVVSVPAIEDIDTILNEKNILYPETKYTFQIECRCEMNGFMFEASEIKREIDGQSIQLSEPFPKRLEARLTQKSGGKYMRGKNAQDTVEFVPYYFEMFSPKDDLYKLSDGREVKLTQIGRYREAKALARYILVNQPKDVDDTRIDELVPDEIVYLSDGRVDRKRELERFKEKIFRGVASKTLVGDGTRAVEGYVDSYHVVFDKQTYSLSSYGKIKIENGYFVVDDRKISKEQFISLLETYEGFTLEFALKGNCE